jgi:CHASE1-domain containing sensor protein
VVRARPECSEHGGGEDQSTISSIDQTGDETTEPVWRLGLEVAASRDSPLRLLPLLTIRAWPWLTLATPLSPIISLYFQHGNCYQSENLVATEQN